MSLGNEEKLDYDYQELGILIFDKNVIRAGINN